MTGYFVCAFREGTQSSWSFHTFASLNSEYIRECECTSVVYVREFHRDLWGRVGDVCVFRFFFPFRFFSFLHFWFWLKACFALGLRVCVQSTGGERCFPFYYSVKSVCAHTESRTSYTSLRTRTHSRPRDMEIRFRVAHGIDGNVQDHGFASPFFPPKPHLLGIIFALFGICEICAIYLVYIKLCYAHVRNRMGCGIVGWGLYSIEIDSYA